MELFFYIMEGIWKTVDGEEVPIKELSNTDLVAAINTSEKQIEKYSSLVTKFEKLILELKEEGFKRINA